MIHILKNISFSLTDLGKNIGKAFLSSFGILFIIAFIVLYLSFRDSVKNYVENNLFGKLAINEIKIYPEKTRADSLFSTASRVNTSIDTGAVKKIRRLKELSRTYSIIRFDYDTRLMIELMGQRTRVMVPVFGLEKHFLKGKDPRWKEFRSKDPLPVIAPRFVFEVFSSSLLTLGLPAITPKSLRGFPLELHIYTREKGKRTRNTIISEAHSFTDVLSLPGIIIPTDYIVEFTRKHRLDTGKAKKGYAYAMMIATVKDIKQLPAITKKLEKMGLQVESRDDIAKKTNVVLDVIDDSSLVIIAILLFLTVISIFNSYLTIVYNRSQKFSLQRILGVSKIRIIIGFVVEAAIIGSIYGCAGFFLGNSLVDYFSHNAARWVPALKNLKIEQAGPGILVMAVGISAMISSLSALIPAIFASNNNLFKAIKK